MDAKTAIATLEAFIAGGDELGDIPEQDALSALQVVTERLDSLRKWWASDVGERDTQLAAANKRIAELDARIEADAVLLAGANKQIGDMQAQLDAIPVKAIHSIYEELAYDDVWDDIGDDLEAVKAWLGTVTND